MRSAVCSGHSACHNRRSWNRIHLNRKLPYPNEPLKHRPRHITDGVFSIEERQSRFCERFERKIEHELGFRAVFQRERGMPRFQKHKRGPLKSGCFGLWQHASSLQRVFCGRIERHGGLEWSSFRELLYAHRDLR